MGWERKRGGSCTADALLRSRRQTDVSRCVRYSGERAFLVTLDAERDADGTVKQLVGTLAHPLNRPRFDAGTRTSWKAMPCCSRG